MAVRALSAHNGQAPRTRLTTRSPSIIDPKNGRKRQHHHPLAARRISDRRQLARRSSRERVHMHTQRGQPWPQVVRESAVFDTCVPSRSGPEHMQPATARGDRRVARGGLAYSLGVDGDR